MSVLILGITFGVIIPNSGKSGDTVSLTGIAFAQSPPDFTAPPDFGANSTGDTFPPDASGSDLSNSPSLNDTIPNPESDLSGLDQNTTLPNPESDLSGLDQNTTALTVENMSNTTGSAPNSSVPEFGTLSLAILVVAVMSFVVISARTRLKFTA
ncbi:MAG: PEFG-CTERM sorting domain-containing protein [Thaumarchaeota archaeon]|nr:PEFG-CTERM sorting domain-containing protein [Nitrososphaerota archaeon]